MKRYYYALIGGMLLALACLGDGPFEEAFAQGNAYYTEGGYAEAVASYTQALEEGGHSAALHYNLGNTYYRLGEIGRAILNYERARWLDPRNPDIAANLRLARKDLPEQTTGALERWTALLSTDGWIYVLVASFWAGLILVAFLPGVRWVGRWILLGMCVLACVGALVGLTGWHLARNDGVVLADETPLRSAPASGSPVARYLRAGEEGRFIEMHGDYQRVALPDGSRGWVAVGAFERILPAVLHKK